MSNAQQCRLAGRFKVENCRQSCFSADRLEPLQVLKSVPGVYSVFDIRFPELFDAARGLLLCGALAAVAWPALGQPQAYEIDPGTCEKKVFVSNQDFGSVSIATIGLSKCGCTLEIITEIEGANSGRPITCILPRDLDPITLMLEPGAPFLAKVSEFCD